MRYPRYTSIRLRLDFERIIRRATAPNAAPTLLFTIFIGANDACFVGQEELVPWPTFSTNIRYFIDTILKKNALAQTKIVLITPPPIDGATSTPLNGSETQEDIDAINAQKKEGVRYKTYMSKKRYAEGLMGIADEYAKTGRVVGLNYWRGMVEASGLGTWEEWEESGLWPGSMLVGAKGFEKGWFMDGLHLDRKGYAVLNKMLMEAVEEKWPELAPEKLENV
jgi:lysophospholipase L1-like esterase